jgi:hypothetical protein
MPTYRVTRFCFRAALIASATVAAVPASAVVTAITPAQFSSTAQLTDFASAVSGQEVNGLAFAGYTFSYSLGNGQLLVGGGPGTTNNVDPLNIVSAGNPTGVLTVTMAGPSLQFGYGYALLASGSIASGTTISLFNGSTNVGSLSYNAVPDPGFPGGYAGIQSTLAFNRVQLTFDSTAAAWAIDNFRVTAVPEPQTVALWAVGGLALTVWSWARRPRG